MKKSKFKIKKNINLFQVLSCSAGKYLSTFLVE